MKKAIFLDRDGTINVEKDYLHKIEDFEFEAGVLEALKLFKELGYLILVVTNQSGIARGYYSEENLIDLNNYMMNEVEKNGGKIEKCYYCPHHSEKGVGKYKIDCNCRKPEPGMLIQGIKEYNIDTKISYIVGDKMSDIEAGEKAGITPILVKTGYGKKILKSIKKELIVHENLLEFALELKKKNTGLNHC